MSRGTARLTVLAGFGSRVDISPITVETWFRRRSDRTPWWLSPISLGQDLVSQPLAERRRGADVDLDPERLLELDPDGEDLDRSGVGCKLDEEVDVAARLLLASAR